MRRIDWATLIPCILHVVAFAGCLGVLYVLARHTGVI